MKHKLDIKDDTKSKMRLTCRYGALNLAFVDSAKDEVQVRLSNAQRNELIERLKSREYHFR